MFKKKHAPASPTPGTPKMRTMELGPTPVPSTPSHASFFRSFKRSISRTSSRADSPYSLLSSPTVVASPTIVAPTPRLPPKKIIIPPSTPRPPTSAPSPTIYAPTPRMAGIPAKALLTTPISTPEPRHRTPDVRHRTPSAAASRHRRHDSDDYGQSSYSDVETSHRTHKPRRRSSPTRRPSSVMPERTPSRAAPSSLPERQPTWGLPTPPQPRSRRTSIDTALINIAAIPLHWQLLPWVPTTGKPRLEFDIINPPASIVVRPSPSHPARRIRPDELNKPAVHLPTVSTLTILQEQCPQWPVVVQPQGGGIFRCEDVFRAVHDTFQVPLTEEEKAELRRDRVRYEACKTAFARRCKRSLRLTQYEERQGLRRVDTLAGCTWFDGLLQPANPLKQHWVLALRQSPANE